MRNKLLASFLFLISTTLCAEFQKLDWEDVKGAVEYKVEIMTGSLIFLETKTTDSELPVDLPPGEYRFRVTIINKFKKEVASSDWSRITVKPKLQPLPIAAEPVFFYDYEDFSLSLLARQIEENAEFGLVGEDGVIPLTLNTRKNELFTLSLPNMPNSGKYKLGIRNESGLETISDFEIEIKTPIAPELIDVDPEKYDISQVYLENVISGNHFEKGMTLSISGPRNAELGEVRVISPKRASFNFNPGGYPPGTYSFKTQNPGNADSVNEISVSLIEVRESFDVSLYTAREDTEGEGSESDGLPPNVVDEDLEDLFNFTADRKKSSLPSGDGRNYIDFGYQYAFVLPDQKEIFSDSALGMLMKVRLNIEGGERQTSPVLKGLGIEAILGYNLAPSHTPEGYFRQLVNTSLNLSYLTDLNLPVNLIGRAGLGYSLSSLFGKGSLGEQNSLSFDFNIQAGAGIRTILESITLEFGAAYTDIYFVNSEWKQIALYFTTGVSF